MKVPYEREAKSRPAPTHQTQEIFMTIRLLIGAFAAAAVLAAPAQAKLTGKVPEPGMVTFVTFSADGCQPCRMMEPALKKLDQEFEGRAAIRELNTSEYPELVPYFRIAAVPTQILYDKNGKELGWHQGYMDEPSMRKAIEDALKASEDKAKDEKVPAK